MKYLIMANIVRSIQTPAVQAVQTVQTVRMMGRTTDTNMAASKYMAAKEVTTTEQSQLSQITNMEANKTPYVWNYPSLDCTDITQKCDKEPFNDDQDKK